MSATRIGTLERKIEVRRRPAANGIGSFASPWVGKCIDGIRGRRRSGGGRRLSRSAGMVVASSNGTTPSDYWTLRASSLQYHLSISAFVVINDYLLKISWNGTCLSKLLIDLKKIWPTTATDSLERLPSFQRTLWALRAVNCSSTRPCGCLMAMIIQVGYRRAKSGLGALRP